MMRGTRQCELKSSGPCPGERGEARDSVEATLGWARTNVTSCVLVHDPVVRRALSSIRSDHPARERRGTFL
jgi:hypothetical protein